jgi:hypothetical protein
MAENTSSPGTPAGAPPLERDLRPENELEEALLYSDQSLAPNAGAEQSFLQNIHMGGVREVDGVLPGDLPPEMGVVMNAGRSPWIELPPIDHADADFFHRSPMQPGADGTMPDPGIDAEAAVPPRPYGPLAYEAGDVRSAGATSPGPPAGDADSEPLATAQGNYGHDDAGQSDLGEDAAQSDFDVADQALNTDPESPEVMSFGDGGDLGFHNVDNLDW